MPHARTLWVIFGDEEVSKSGNSSFGDGVVLWQLQQRLIAWLDIWVFPLEWLLWFEGAALEHCTEFNLDTAIN